MNFTNKAKQIALSFLREGDFVIDATCGNGHDTLFLSDIVGKSGKVFAFDVQQRAIESSKALLAKSGKTPQNVQFVLDGHENMENHLPEAVKGKLNCAVFNLGYLPNSNKTVITKPQSTLKALQSCLDIRANRFLLSVLCYVGHEGGQGEYEAVRDFFKQNFAEFSEYSDEKNLQSPKLLLVKMGE